MSLQFIYLATLSLFVGIIFGLLASLLLKHINMNDEPIKECIILALSAYLSYLFAE
jgi:NhaP-type Na+/H+ or K+/H+ antiporter